MEGGMERGSEGGREGGSDDHDYYNQYTFINITYQKQDESFNAAHKYFIYPVVVWKRPKCGRMRQRE